MKLSTALVEVVNLAEITLILTKLGGLVFRPEADIEGVDFLVKSPRGEFSPANSKVSVSLRKENTVGETSGWCSPARESR